MANILVPHSIRFNLTFCSRFRIPPTFVSSSASCSLKFRLSANFLEPTPVNPIEDIEVNMGYTTIYKWYLTTSVLLNKESVLLNKESVWCFKGDAVVLVHSWSLAWTSSAMVDNRMYPNKRQPISQQFEPIASGKILLPASTIPSTESEIPTDNRVLVDAQRLGLITGQYFGIGKQQ